MLSRQEVADRLESHNLPPTFRDAHIEAVGRLKKFAKKWPAWVAALNSTEVANFLHGQVRSVISVAVEPMPKVHVTSWDIFTVAVGGDLLVRFKSLNKGAPANHQSEQQDLLALQQYTEETMAVLSLAGIDRAPTTVTCGYRLEGFDLADVSIRRDRKYHQTWLYNIYGDEGVVEPLLLSGIREAKPAVVRSKRSAEKVNEEG